MSRRQEYAPGPASGATIDKDGDKWTLVLVRELKHPPAKVWSALTDPAQLREWAPFESDANLGATGTVANLSTVGSPRPHVTETKVKRADAPKLLEFTWADRDIRWELEPLNGGTRLTLWANIDKNWIAMGASGWHVALDVLDRMLAGWPIGRIAGPEAMQVGGWNQLMAGYATLLGVELPRWG
ncbi:MAG TPA: SRPBCC domain-containing protein [Gemmatimonadaceae bacterium]